MGKDDHPTERQVAYAKDLGVEIPKGISRGELSRLIDEELARQNPPSELNLAAASDFGVEVEYPLTKKGLFDLIWDTLESSGRDEDLAAWFAYRICRGCMEGGPDHPDAAGVNSSTIRRIAQELSSDPKLIKSIKRYGPRDVIWFGRWTTPDGMELEGGSKRTASFKAAAMMIQRELGLEHRNKRASAGRGSNRTASRQQGCLVIAVGLVVVPALLFRFLW